MSGESLQRILLRAAFVAGLSACASAQALGAEVRFCVTCKGPDQTYLCRVDGGGLKAGDALKLYCVMRTAKEGHHASCAAERATPACNGILKTYSYDGPVPEDFARAKHFADKIKQDQKVFEKPKGNQPNTLVELTGRAFKASRDGIRSARDRIGGQPEDGAQPQGEAAAVQEQPESLNPQPDSPAADNAPPPPVAEDQPNRLQRASSAAGGFARKSYRCVISLFRHCSDDEAADQALR
ncbi:MAG TPA: hypothetical protein VNJ31_02375 [Methyloceanibacter sp.]|nr:hypothetical protein [Methyloceanibacter sp.]